MAENVNWEGIRAEYLAGNVSQEALAAKHGVTFYALRKVARAEGWAAKKSSTVIRSPELIGGGEACREEVRAPDGDAEVALRLRNILLRKLERAATIIPDDATEQKTQDGSTVKLLKLRDLTAAYKELVGDLAADDGAGEETRVVVDV